MTKSGPPGPAADPAPDRSRPETVAPAPAARDVAGPGQDSASASSSGDPPADPDAEYQPL